MSGVAMRQAFIGIDVGTSSARAGVFDEKGSLLATARHPITVWHETGSVVGIGRLRSGCFRIEHGVIDNELAAPGKQVQQGDLPALAFEGVVLVDQLPRKLAALATQLVAEMGELLFLGQVLLTRGDPFFV